jgi:hypothetical protein
MRLDQGVIVLKTFVFFAITPLSKKAEVFVQSKCTQAGQIFAG